MLCYRGSFNKALHHPRMALHADSSGTKSTARTAENQFLKLCEYLTPPWASNLKLVPSKRYQLGMLPTPIHKWSPQGLPDTMELWIKRDDLSGMQLSGNKVRKLEFLLADAVAQGADCVITIGGIQSNHCRATAVAARYLGLDTHLILRTSRAAVEHDPGLVGNLLVERMVGAHVHLVTKEEYGRVGSVRLGQQLKEQLEAEGHKPYVIPVGGSNALGTWGYVQCIEEIREQIQGMGITDIAMACGSGGTTAGLALGAHLAGLGTRVHAYAVCDDEDYFYHFVDQLIDGLGPSAEDLGGRTARDLFRAVQAKGVGYALSTTEELQTVQRIALTTGVVLDPVYSGKAMHRLLGEMAEDPAAWRGRKLLFIHTGGLLGMYDKLDQLQPVVEGLGRSKRMQVAS